MDFLIQLGFGLVLLLVGLSAGMVAERKHLRDLAAREAVLLREVLVTDLRSFPSLAADAGGAMLVTGESVISSDYFKTFVAALKKIIGGELRTLETLMSRARREAVLRMVELARRQGYDAVCNVRLETVDISGSEVASNKGMTMATVVASGTAYRRSGSGTSASAAPAV